jgi:hypothetical protein
MKVTSKEFKALWKLGKNIEGKILPAVNQLNNTP